MHVNANIFMSYVVHIIVIIYYSNRKELIHGLYTFNHNVLILGNIGTTYIQWGRSSCTADDTDIVYSGKHVQSVDLYPWCMNARHSNDSSIISIIINIWLYFVLVLYHLCILFLQLWHMFCAFMFSMHHKNVNNEN